MERDISIPAKGNELVVRIAGGRPLRASELGDLLTSLSRDYRQMHRSRNLAVVRVETGSILIVLMDAALAAKPYVSEGLEYAKGAKALLDFAKALKDLIGKKKAMQPHSEDDPRQGPYRTIESMVKMAIESGSEISVRHVSTDGQTLDLKVTPKEGQEIRERSRVAQIQAIVDRPNPADAYSPKLIAADQARAFADDIEKLALAGSRSPDPLIGAVVRLLRDSGNAYLIETLAWELEARGHSDLADAVRAEGGNDQRGGISATRES